jgi:hypothetical protein
MTAIVVISPISTWIIRMISVVWIFGVVSAVGIRGVVTTVVTIGRVADGAITARRCDRGDERDWKNAPGHGEPRPITKQRVCHPR